MTHRLAIALLFLPLAASAAPSPPAAGANPAGDGARSERFEKRMRLARTLGLAEALDLSEAEALKMRDAMAKFDERRKPLMKELRENARTVHRAAEGDKDAVGQVDQAVQRVFDGREKMHAIDREMYQTLAKDLSPARRARLAVFFAQYHQRMGRMMMEHRAGMTGQGCMGQGCGERQGGPGPGPGMHGPGGKGGPAGGPGGQMGMNGPGPDGDDDLFGEQ